MEFEIEGEISNIGTFASGRGIPEISRLNKVYGKGKWRKRKGNAVIRFRNGESRHAELHSNESTGIGKKEIKIKRLLD